MRFLERLFSHRTPNPETVGQVKMTKDEVDPEALARLNAKFETAQAYIRERGIVMKPLYNKLKTVPYDPT